MVDTRLLVVLDDSVASRRAVKYVGKFVGKRRGFRVCLVQVLPPLPPELQEHGGSEDGTKRLGPGSCDPAKSGDFGWNIASFVLRTRRRPGRS
jgi:hypothetical protein